MRSLFRPPPVPPSPPDVATILRDVEQLIGDDKSLTALVEFASNEITGQLGTIAGQLTALTSQVTAAEAHFDSRLDQIEAELNPVLAPTALQFWVSTYHCDPTSHLENSVT